MSDDFPTPEGIEIDDSDERPGEPLHPGKHTIVDGDNNALKQGEVIQVWFEAYADAHGTETVTGKIQVIGDDGEGDIFAIPEHQKPSEASRVYRVHSDLTSIEYAYVLPVPEYDHEEGVLTVTKQVNRRGNLKNNLLEARSHGIEDYWRDSGEGL